MTTDSNSTTRSDTGTETVDHKITAYEAHWQKTKFRYDPDSMTDVEITYEEPQEPVEGTVFQWEYYCQCGKEFSGYDKAKQHLLDHAKG